MGGWARLLAVVGLFYLSKTLLPLPVLMPASKDPVWDYWTEKSTRKHPTCSYCAKELINHPNPMKKHFTGPLCTAPPDACLTVARNLRASIRSGFGRRPLRDRRGLKVAM